MIISVHMPKTGGETFGHALEAAFGPRLLRDYGDRVGFVSDDITAHRRKRAQAMLAERDEIERSYDIIHGHFVADKYRGIFRAEQYVAFFRNPAQQAISHYRYLRRVPLRKDPTIADVQGAGVTFVDFLKRETVTNSLTEMVGSVPLEHFAMVAVSEEFDRGVALFNATFGCNLETGERANVDPERAGRLHILEPWERRAVQAHRRADVELYARAKEMFDRLCVARGL
jgi:hypothetical protein